MPFTGTLMITTARGTVLAQRQVWLLAPRARAVLLDLTAAGVRALDHRPDVRGALRFRDRAAGDDARLPDGVPVMLRR